MSCITFLFSSSFCAAKHDLQSFRTCIILARASDKTVYVEAKAWILAILKNCNKIGYFVCASFVDELRDQLEVFLIGLGRRKYGL